MAMVMASSATSVPYVDLRISDGSHLMSDAKDLVHQLRKEWSLDEIRAKEFSEGYNNKLVAFMHDDDVKDMSDVIVVRVYGPQTDMIVNREQEIKCMVLFHRAGCAAQLYCRFNNGFAYQYSPGRVLDLDHAYDPHVMRLLTKELARVHCVKPEAIRTDDVAVKKEGIQLDAKPRLFAALDNFLQILPESFDEMEKQAKLEKMAASREELKKEVDYLRSFLCPLGSPVVLCHNDLLFNNILYNDETQKVSFIDFEFAAFNYQAFDIATHFCEYAGMKVVDYSNLPDRSYQLRWLRSYLESYFEFQGRAAGKVSDDEVEKLYDQVDKFTLGAHMFWGMWALVQSKYSDIDYDYLDYARIRISEYYRRKQDFLAQDADH